MAATVQPMKKLSAKFHLATGLTSIVTSMLLAAILLGLIPNRTQAIVDGRVTLAESIASSSTLFLLQGDKSAITKNLEFALSRNPDLIAASITSRKNDQAIVIGEQSVITDNGSNQASTESRIVLPILEKDSTWGEIVLYFSDSSGTSKIEQIKNSNLALISAFGLASFILFYLYLGKMLKALNPSQAVPGRVRSALDTLAEALLVIDRKSNVVLTNKAFQEINGQESEKLLGRKATDFNWHLGEHHPDESPSSEKAQFPWQLALESKETIRGAQLWLKSKDDVWHKFLVNCSPIVTGNVASGVLISLDDVTELVQKEKELRLARDAAEEANTAKSDFLSNMSHEIRTPMTAILGFTEVLKRSGGKSDNNWQKHLNTISSSGKHLLELINDVLDLSKVESGALEVELLDCAPHAVANDVMQVLRVRAEEKGIGLKLRIPEALPEYIQTDASRLRQIITNLVGNAIKFTEKGGVEIILRTEVNNGVQQYAVDVTDSGIGMNAEQQSAVFKPFVQADSSITRRFGGTGLGLSISRRLARALGGDILVSSKAGIGTTFTAIINAGDLNHRVFKAPEILLDSLQEATTEEHTTWVFPPSNVLIIDDAIENRELLTLVLNDLGIDTQTAENGAIGVEMVHKNEYDIILSDIQMPVMDGYEAASAMRNSGIKQPIIALTANAMMGHESKVLDAGFSHYMTKPIDIDALTALLAKLLKGKPVSKPHHDLADESEGVNNTHTEIEGLPLYSRLSSSPKFAVVIEKFIAKLQNQLPVMEQAIANQNYDELAALGHWLKGSGGTVGFDQLSEPARCLEDNAKASKHDAVRENLDHITQIAGRLSNGIAPKVSDPVNIQPSGMVNLKGSSSLAAPPVESHLLKDPAFRPIVLKFLPRLKQQLDAMQQAFTNKDYDELAQLAHWLKGSGGTVGFDVFTKPSADLEISANQRDDSSIALLLDQIGKYADNIVVPGNDDNISNKNLSA